MIDGTFIYNGTSINIDKLVDDLDKANANIVVIQYLVQYSDWEKPMLTNSSFIDKLIARNTGKKLKIYTGLHYMNNWWQKVDLSFWTEYQKNVVDEIYKYWQYSIEGIYIPEEAWLCNYSNDLLTYYKNLSNYIKKKGYKTLIAPYFTPNYNPSEVAQSTKKICNNTSIDIIAIQDGIGCGRVTPEQAKPYIQNFANTCRNNGVIPWLDMEICHFNTKTPFTYDEVMHSLNLLEPYVDKVITYAYCYWTNNIPTPTPTYKYTKDEAIALGCEKAGREVLGNWYKGIKATKDQKDTIINKALQYAREYYLETE